MQTKIVTKAKMHSGKCRQRDSKKFFERNLPIVSPPKKNKSANIRFKEEKKS
jgi:hypothetical protein